MSFAWLAWLFLAYNIVVIVWGALVRATGSGAGCGSHWPLCNGEWVPHHPQLHTLIELTHRGMSGAALVGVIACFVWTRRFPRGSVVRQAAVAALVFMLSEAALGAGLVLLRLVEHDASLLRAVYLSAHLLNTFLLIAALTLLAWASVRPAVMTRQLRLPQRSLWGAAVLGVLAVSILGGLAALGDTLFPAGSLTAGLANDVATGAHPLVRLRALHPLLAIVVGLYLLMLIWTCRATKTGRARRAAQGLAIAIFCQWGVGLGDLLLLAPVTLQLAHLFMAQAVWVFLVLCVAEQAAATVTD